MSSDDWVARINRVVEAVRDDLAGSHTLAELAERAHSSDHHFHRRFREVTGETPRQFVRRCRLERAAYLMMAAPERRLTDICVDVGFRDPSDFSRSFRQLYGVAPSRWDRRSPMISAPQTEVPPVRIITRPAMRLAVVRIRGVFGIDDLSPGYATLLDWLDDRGIDPDRSTLVGMSYDNYRTTPRERIHYSFGFAVPDDVAGSGPVHVRHLPAFTAAAVSVDGGLPTIGAAWDHLYDDWFPAAPWAPSAAPAMKLFRTRPDQLGWQTFDLDCAVAFRLGKAGHGAS